VIGPRENGLPSPAVALDGPGHPVQLSLAIPTPVGVMSTGDGYGHRNERNGEFCVTAGLLPWPYWHSWLKALAVNGARHTADVLSK